MAINPFMIAPSYVVSNMPASIWHVDLFDVMRACFRRYSYNHGHGILDLYHSLMDTLIQYVMLCLFSAKGQRDTIWITWEVARWWLHLLVYYMDFECNTWSNKWWRHQMETCSALLAICAGNSPATGEFPAQRPVTRSFDVFFDLCLNERLSMQSWGWGFETPSRPLWRHSNDNTAFHTVPGIQFHGIERTYRNRDHSVYGLCQWETTLHFNTVSNSSISQISQCIRQISDYAPFVTEMCTHVHISVTKWGIVWHGAGALWDLCNRTIAV